ncbi:MAG: radical SAM protein [Deltaproteobacteria bacterium]|nr:radical SAM protein [Deltaproteobacteria bacterium]
MRDLICPKFCAYYKPDREEAEKCLAFELLWAWGAWKPELAPALTQAASAPHSYPVSPGAAGHFLDRICSRCAFRAHGCDFAAGGEAAAPCGGWRALAYLLEAGHISGADLAAAWERFLMEGYLRLAEHVSLRYLETPHLYDRLADELYEVNEAGFVWLARSNGATPGLAGLADREFLDFLLGEALLAIAAAPAPRRLTWRPSPLPSLRYLELMLTERCNLRCRHCYLGEAGEQELPLAAVLQTLQEFQEMQGLRVLFSGGEPLLYRHWEELNRQLPDFDLRLVLLSNGLLLTDDVIRELKVHEVQLSLDGLETGHDLVRGKGTWAKTVDRLAALQQAGVEVSVATMIHRGNAAELEEMSRWLQELGVREWNLDIPCLSGRLADHQDLCLDPAQAAVYLELGFGGSAHGATGDFACGRHLAAVLPHGTVAKCGLYGHRPLGRLEEGLETCWLRLPHLHLSDLECAPCAYVHDCRGGCRFRAGGGLAPDPVMCARYGVDPTTFRR